MDLTTTQEDARPGVWGGGRDLVLELDEGSLKLIEPDTGACLNSQPIHAIRVSSKPAVEMCSVFGFVKYHLYHDHCCCRCGAWAGTAGRTSRTCLGTR